jgi:hypothetical protein
VKQRLKDWGTHLLPWSGIIGAAAGWGLTHQIGSNSVFDKCPATSPVPMLLLGLLGLAAIAAGGLLSRRLWKRGAAETEARRFLSLIGMMMSGLFAVALVFQTVSALIIPQCYG